MLITFHVVQNKYRPVTGRKLGDGAREPYSVDCPYQPPIIIAIIPLDWLTLGILGFVQRDLVQTLLPQVHQHNVNRQTMQPSRKGRFTPESRNLSEKLKKCLLSKVLGLRWVAQHAKTQRIHTPLMGFKERSKSLLVASLGTLNQLSLCSDPRYRLFL